MQALGPEGSLSPAPARSAVLAVLLAAGIAGVVQALAARRLAGLDPSASGGYDVFSAPVTDPLIHIVALPAWFFLAYTLLQLAGSWGEVRRVSETGRGDLAGVCLWISGRRSRTDGPPLTLADLPRIDQQVHRPIDFGIGALTMLGLLGTVIGLSLALQDLPAVMDPGASVDERAAVLTRLGFAFATTIIGIVGSLLLSLARIFLRAMADNAAEMLARDAARP